MLITAKLIGTIAGIGTFFGRMLIKDKILNKSKNMVSGLIVGGGTDRAGNIQNYYNTIDTFGGSSLGSILNSNIRSLFKDINLLREKTILFRESVINSGDLMVNDNIFYLL